MCSLVPKPSLSPILHASDQKLEAGKAWEHACPSPVQENITKLREIWSINFQSFSVVGRHFSSEYGQLQLLTATANES